LLERAQGDGERAAAIADLQAGVRRSTHLVTQLLTLARQDPDLTGRAEGRVDLAALARTAVVEHAPQAEKREIDLGLTRADAAAVIRGDADGVRILLRNLLDNALRYTPRGGAVDVAVSVSDHLAVLEVSDSGPGIPADDRERVFDRFFRGSGTGEPGTGLGLSIVKSIADRHRARIELGRSVLGGLEARVLFPLSTEGR
jgi:two-component system OmpR family sensor kinase